MPSGCARHAARRRPRHPRRRLCSRPFISDAGPPARPSPGCAPAHPTAAPGMPPAVPRGRSGVGPRRSTGLDGPVATGRSRPPQLGHAAETSAASLSLYSGTSLSPRRPFQPTMRSHEGPRTGSTRTRGRSPLALRSRRSPLKQRDRFPCRSPPTCAPRSLRTLTKLASQRPPAWRIPRQPSLSTRRHRPQPHRVVLRRRCPRNRTHRRGSRSRVPACPSPTPILGDPLAGATQSKTARAMASGGAPPRSSVRRPFVAASAAHGARGRNAQSSGRARRRGRLLPTMKWCTSRWPAPAGAAPWAVALSRPSRGRSLSPAHAAAPTASSLGKRSSHQSPNHQVNVSRSATSPEPSSDARTPPRMIRARRTFAWDAPRGISPEGARAAARAARPTAGPAERESRRARRRASPCSRERTAPSARTAGRRPSSLWSPLPRSHPHPLRASADIEPTFSRPVLWPPLPPECALRVRRALRRLR